MVRLPPEFHFQGKEVFIEKSGDAVVLRPKPLSWEEFFARIPILQEDLLADRREEPPQDREWFHDMDACTRLMIAPH